MGMKIIELKHPNGTRYFITDEDHQKILTKETAEATLVDPEGKPIKSALNKNEDCKIKQDRISVCKLI